jgi:cell wall-associated NlpC family hydrolase
VNLDSRRQRVVAEALGWLGTPYRPAQRVKGPAGGADCLTLVVEVYERAGILPHYEVPYYPLDWHLHRSIERLSPGRAGIRAGDPQWR